MDTLRIAVGDKLMTTIEGVATLVVVTAIKRAGEEASWTSAKREAIQVVTAYGEGSRRYWVRTASQLWLPTQFRAMGG